MKNYKCLTSYPCFFEMQYLGSLQSVHSGQEPDWVRPDQPLQTSDRERGAGVWAGVWHVQSDPTVSQTSLNNTQVNIHERRGHLLKKFQDSNYI